MHSLCWVSFNAKHVSKHVWFYALQMIITIKTRRSPPVILLVQTAASRLPRPYAHAATRCHIALPVTAIYLPPVSHTKVPSVRPVVTKSKTPTTCVPASKMWSLRSRYQLLSARIPLTPLSKSTRPSSVAWFKTIPATILGTLHAIYVSAKIHQVFNLK